MRCENCFYINKDGAINCIKCGAPLKNNDPFLSSRPAVIGGSTSETRRASDTYGPTGTIIGGTISDARRASDTYGPTGTIIGGTTSDARRSSDTYGPTGTIIGGTTSDARRSSDTYGPTGTIIGGTTSDKQCASDASDDQNKTVIKTAVQDNKTNSTVLEKDLTLIKDSVDAKTAFRLTAIDTMGDDEVLEFSGEETILNRANVDPCNKSISSNEQAAILCVDGCFYIIDKSELKTTFVRATKCVELEEGDIICLGNRKYKFGKSR